MSCFHSWSRLFWTAWEQNVHQCNKVVYRLARQVTVLHVIYAVYECAYTHCQCVYAQFQCEAVDTHTVSVSHCLCGCYLRSFLQPWGICCRGVAFLFVQVSVTSPVGKIWTATLVLVRKAVQHRKAYGRRN